jgi:WD40 repeat protein
MNREAERSNLMFNNQEVRENILSPVINRTVISSNSEYKQSSLNESVNSHHNYSPFVIKKSSNLQGSNYSSASSNKMFTDSQNYKIYTPSPHVLKERLSDRFIPMNKGLNLLEKFELTKKWSKDNGSDSKTETNEQGSGQKGRSNTYSDLLENNFFGNDSVNYATSGEFISKPKQSIQELNSVKSKLFSFREEHKRKSHGLLFNNNLINCDAGDNVSSIRKIGNKPYKKIDAPGLIDDFYLNLVDWSNKNDIAVGQSNCVFLWCANKTQCVKLLEYEGDKYVSSVIWNTEGTQVAVGNSDGLVEIWDGKKYYKILIKNIFKY